MNGQYSAYTEGEDIYPLPNKGVVSIGSDFQGLLTKIQIFDESGFLREVQNLPPERLGNFGDFVLSDQELYVIPSFWVDYDVIADMGFNLLNVSNNSVSLTYNSPFQYSNLIAEKSIGLGSVNQHLAISEGDSLHLISSSGTLVNSIALPEPYEYTETVDLAGHNSSYEYSLICRPSFSTQQSTIFYLNADAEIINSETVNGKSLASWSESGVPMLFFDKGYMELEASSLTPYPSSLGVVEAAYDAVDVAVLRNAENQYFSFTPSEGFVAISAPGKLDFKRIYKRPEGWYTFVAGILSFSPDSLGEPPTNPLNISVQADSAIARVRFSGPMNIPTTTYSVNYTLELTNTSSESVTSVEIETLGPSGSYDPFNHASFAKVDSFGSIAPAESVSLSAAHSYSLAGNLPEARAGLYACIISVNSSHFLGGEPSCSSGVTSRVSDNKELPDGGGPLVAVYPNPISYSFRLETTQVVRSIQLFNAIGQVVQHFEGSPSQRYQLGDNVAPGLYTLQVQFVNGESRSTEVLINR